jgi:hypothetical protein
MFPFFDISSINSVTSNGTTYKSVPIMLEGFVIILATPDTNVLVLVGHS